MCVSCLGSVDALAWGAVGAGTTFGAIRQQVRVRRTAAQSSTHEQLVDFVVDARSSAGDLRSYQRDDAHARFLIALVSYIAAGLVLKSVVLNWVVGPLYLVGVAYVLPTALRRLAGAVRA